MTTTNWDERYAEGRVFGSEPNDFLRAEAPRIPRGRVLCLAEGYGRNAVWLAAQGFDVTAMDSSAVGLDLARAFARERGVAIATEQASLADYEIARGAWQGIVSIFAHVPPEIRAHVHALVGGGLAPGGVFLLEAYRPEQIGRGTGGPSDDEKMMNLVRLRAELGPGLEWEIAREVDRAVNEGPRHQGMASVVQVVARKP